MNNKKRAVRQSHTSTARVAWPWIKSSNISGIVCYHPDPPNYDPHSLSITPSKSGILIVVKWEL